MNVLEDIPYDDEVFGRRKVVDEPALLMMQVALVPGQSIPRHDTNGDLHLLVIRGRLKVSHGSHETDAPEGAILRLPHGTSMGVSNESEEKASFLVMKAPNPGAPA
jgi:quercetin dioxygenase-like cupin family protein